MAERRHFLYLFETEGAFESAYTGEDYHEPWVSYVREVERVDYNKSEHEKMKEVPLTFEITSNGNITWSYYNDGDYEDAHTTIYYRKNDGDWTVMPRTLSVVSGDAVQFRGDNDGYGDTDMGDGNFDSFSEETTAGFILKGNIMSLIDSTGFTTASTLPTSCYQNFNSLFYGCTSLTSAENLILPATALTMGCYRHMFDSCTSLTTAPELPATTLVDFCYYGMFAGCTNLTKAPKLPATALTQACYTAMFQSCTSLTTAPELPATILADSCYGSMFYGCTNLNYIKCLATSISASNCTSYWVTGVASSGTFVADSNTQWASGVNGIPEGWIRQ